MENNLLRELHILTAIQYGGLGLSFKLLSTYPLSDKLPHAAIYWQTPLQLHSKSEVCACNIKLLQHQMNADFQSLKDILKNEQYVLRQEGF